MTEKKSIYDEYFELHRKYISEYGEMNTIVLMQVGIFYEMYGLRNTRTQEIKLDAGEPRISEFGRICELAVVPKSKVFYGPNKEYNVLMCGFKDDLADKYVRKMQNEGFTIVIYNQDESVKNVKITRSLFTVVSPGTYCGSGSRREGNEPTSNTLCCLWFYLKDMQKSVMNTNKQVNNKIYVGMSSVDIYTGKTVLFEFSRNYYPKLNNPNLFDPLDRYLTIYNPVEIVVILDNITTDSISKIMKSVNTRNVKKTHTITLNETDSPSEPNANSNSNSNSKCVSRAKNCEKQIYQREVLMRFYPDMSNIYMNQFSEHVFSTQSFCYLLDFIHQHNTSLTRHISLPIFDNVGENLILENSSLLQLNILDDGKQIHSKYASVAKMCANEAQTPMGKRKITDMILHPITNSEILNREYDVVASAITDSDSNKLTIQDWLASVKDLSQYLRLVYWKRITPKQLYFLYESIQNIKQLYNYFLSKPNIHVYFQKTLSDYSNLLVSMSQITSFIDSVLNIDKCKLVNGSLANIGNELYILKKNANVELNRNLSALYESRDQLECCRTFFDGLLKNSGTKRGAKADADADAKADAAEDDEDENIEENDEDCDDSLQFGSNKERNVKINCTQTNNYTISTTELRSEEISKRLDEMHTSSNSSSSSSSLGHSFVNISYTSTNTQESTILSLKIGKENTFSSSKKKTLSSSLKPVVDFIKTSARSKNRYIKSAQIDDFAFTLSSAKKNIADTIRRAYFDILTKLETYDTQIISVIQYVSSLDSILARAKMADNNGYCRPEIKDTNDSMSPSPSPSPSFVDAKNIRHCIIEKIQTDEIYVANDVSLNARGILLYGVNAVGKTSLIRSLGIAIIMAQSGFFVPASQFCFKPYTKLFTRILGNDCLAKGLSTFVVEMLELNPILQHADQNSIVLGDELCSGTETPSAISLNLASLVRLCGRNVSFILATHYHELANLEEIRRLDNLSIMHMSMFFDQAKDTLVYNRKLQTGIGSNRYGLEVCKSLKMPDEFIDMANEFRMKYYADAGAGSILDQKTSVYNSAHVRGMCGKCASVMATEVHHLLPQRLADKNGLISDPKTGTIIHKNHIANLLSVCERCHLEFHHDKAV